MSAPPGRRRVSTPPAVARCPPPRARLELTPVSFGLQRARHRVLVPRDVRLTDARRRAASSLTNARTFGCGFDSRPSRFRRRLLFVSFSRPVPRPVPAAEVLRRRRRPRREFQRRRARRRAFLSNVVHDPGSSSSGGVALRASLWPVIGEDQRRARDVTRRRAPPSPIRTPLTRHSSPARLTRRRGRRRRYGRRLSAAMTPRAPARRLWLPKRIARTLVARTSAVAARTARSTTPTPSLIISSALESPVNRPDARSHASTARSRFAAARRVASSATRRGFVRRRRWRQTPPPPSRRATRVAARPACESSSSRESNPFRFEVPPSSSSRFDRRRRRFDRRRRRLRVLLPRAAGGPSRGNETGGEGLLVGRTIRSRHREMCRRADGSSAKASSSSAAVLGGGGGGAAARAPLRGVATSSRASPPRACRRSFFRLQIDASPANPWRHARSSSPARCSAKSPSAVAATSIAPSILSARSAPSSRANSRPPQSEMREERVPTGNARTRRDRDRG